MPLTPASRRPALRACLVALALACGGEPVGPGPVPRTISTVSGGGWSGEVGVALPFPVRITVEDGDGRRVAGAVVEWAVTAGGGTVSPATSRTDSAGSAATTWVLGTVAGPQALRAQAGAAVAAVVAHSVAGATARVHASPDSGTLSAIGETARFEARPTDAHGNLTAATPVTWRSLDERVASVDAGGLVTAQANGAARLVATAGPASDTATVTVRQVVARLGVVPQEASLALGDTAAIVATASDPGGTPVPGAAIQWTSSDAAVVAVSDAGLLTARAEGRATVTASAGGQQASAALVVTTVAIAGLTARPPALALTVGESRPLVLEARSASGALLAGRIIALTSADPGVAHVSPLGVVTAVSPGATSIEAEAEGHTARVPVRVTPAPVESVVLTLNAPSVAAGEATEGTVAVFAADKRALAGRAVEVTSSDAAVVRATAAGTRVTLTGVAPGAATITAASEGKRATVAFAVTPAVVRKVVVVPNEIPLVVGGTAQLSARPTGGDGAAVTGRGTAWRSSDAAVATVSDAGLVTGRRGGRATITASVDGVEGTGTVVVAPAPVFAVTVTPSAPTLPLNATLALAAVLTDAGGAVLTGRAVSWGSSAPAVAAVSPTGVVTPLAVGTAEIAATSEGRRGFAVVTVVPGTSAFVARTIPDTMVAGRTATIVGYNFAPTPSANVVTVAGVRATVLTATPAELTVAVPPVSAFGCGAVAGAEVAVHAPAGAASRRAYLRTATVHALARGDAIVPTASDTPCYEVAPGPGRYVLAVVNTSAAPERTASFRLRGARVATGAPATPAAPAGARFTVAPAAMSSDPAARAHVRAMEASRALVRRLGRPRAAAAGMGAVPRLSIGAGVPGATGAPTTVKLPKLGDLCATQATLAVRTAYAGTRAIILEDVASPTAGRADALYRTIGETFDRSQYDMISRNFADPLTFDGAPSMSHVGKVVMVFSPRVAQLGLLGFVSSGDFYAPSQCGASNQASVLYAGTPSASDGSLWARRMAGTVAHEVKHIASFAERMARPGEYESSWLEEATAQAAAELHARDAHGYAQFGNADYAAAMRCEADDEPAGCAGKPQAITHPMSWLAEYMRGVEGSSPVDDADNAKYGGGWYLLRWALDHSGQAESQVLRALTTDKQRTGVANLLARLGGRSFGDVATGFALALAADDFPGAGGSLSSAVDEPSWNLRDVQQHAYGGYQLRTAAVPPGDFTVDVAAVWAGSAAYFTLVVPNDGGAGQVVGLAPGAAGTTVSGLRLALVRVE